MKLSDYPETDNLMLLFKGESGAGKTTALASFPEPVYVACCDGRIGAIRNNPLLANRDIDFDIFDSFDKVVEKLDNLSHGSRYRTVAIDPLFGYARLVIKHLMSARGAATEIKIQGEKVPLNIGGIPIMAINEYKGEESALFNMVMLMRVIRQHGANVILTAHVITSEQPKLGGGSSVTRRLLTGGNKIAAEIPTYFDEIYHFYNAAPGLSDEKRFYATTSGNGDDYARTSFWNLQKEIDFTNKSFYEQFKKAIEVSKKTVNSFE